MNQTEVKKNQIQFYTYALYVLAVLAFGKRIGSNGLAHFIAGMECMALFLVFVAGNIPDVLGKMIRYRRKRSRYIDAGLYKKRVFYLQLSTSILFFFILFLFADLIADKLLQIPNGGLIIRILSPVLILRMFGSGMLGYFQSFGSYVQSVLSNVLRLLFFVILGHFFSNGMLEFGDKAASLLKNEDFYGMYGAVGLALAVLVTEILILILLIFFYGCSDRKYDEQKSKDGMRKAESAGTAALSFVRMSRNGVIFRLFVFVFGLIGILLLQDKQNVSIYAGEYLLICSLPILLICARFFRFYARISYLVKGENSRQSRDMILLGMQYGWCAGILAGVLLAVLTKQLAAAYWEESEILKQILPHGAFLIPSVILLVYFSVIHIAHNKGELCLLTISGGMVLFVLTGLILENRMESKIQAVVCAGWISLGITCLVLGILTMQKYRLHPEYVRSFLIPLVCVGIVGLILYGLSRFLTPHIGNPACFCIGILLGVILYLVLLSVCRVFSESDLDQIYGKMGRTVLSVIFK